jgi:hypothetical protein
MAGRDGGRQRSCSPTKDSPEAARELGNAAVADSWDVAEELAGETDGPHGCYVEADGVCPHGWRSAALSAGLH